MLNASYRIAELSNGEKVPVIDLGKENSGLACLLLADEHVTLEDIMDSIHLVEGCASDVEVVNDELSTLEIKREGCRVFDNFAGVYDENECFQTIFLSIDELKKIVTDWMEERAKLINTINGEV